MNQISVCIPTSNNAPILEKCLYSIVENTLYPNFKIIVYLNNCLDTTKEILKNFQDLIPNKFLIINSSINKGFIDPCNHMINIFPNNDVILLNDDTIVPKGWIIDLIKSAYTSKKIGIAGATLINEIGVLQEFGAEIYSNGHIQNFGRDENIEKNSFKFPRYTGYVSGCCMYIKRTTIKKIGVLSKKFVPYYFEDSEYCYRARKNNLLTIVSPHPQVIHLDGSTSKKMAGVDKIVQKNKKTFFKLYKNFILSEQKYYPKLI